MAPRGSAIACQTVQEFILGGLQPLDLRYQLVPMERHGRDVSLCATVLPIRDGRLGDQRPNPCIVGIGDEVGELLLGHR